MSAGSLTLPQEQVAWQPKFNPWLIAAVVSTAAFMEVLDTSIDRLGATPQSREVSVNREIQSRKSRLRPNVDASHPVMGSTTAFDTR